MREINILDDVRAKFPSFGRSEHLEAILGSVWGKIAVGILAIYFLLGIFGPMLPLSGPFTTIETAEGYALLESPSLQSIEQLFGTTSNGYSVFNQTIWAFRTSLFVGVLSGLIVTLIGVNIGLIAGYFGGIVDRFFMAVVDFSYGLPFYPFAIVVIALFGTSLVNIAIIIALTFWRNIARIIRSETLSVKERNFVKASRASGSSNLTIMYYHILPNLIPIIVLYFVFGIVWGILFEASLSFIGLGPSETMSWGLMLHKAFGAAAMTSAWWWVVPPAFCLWLFIASLYVVGRKFEENMNTPLERTY